MRARPVLHPQALRRSAVGLTLTVSAGLGGAQSLPASESPPTPKAASAAPTVRTLRDTPLTRSADGRKQLQYLVSCALTPEQAVRYTMGGQSTVLHGSMGLAPGWFDGGLKPQAQRRVSACILARTNYFGQRVEISMRADWPDAPAALRTDAQEEKAFPRMEGRFFGNLFSAAPSAYVCTPHLPNAAAVREQAQWAASHRRICAQSDGADTARSPCHFIRLGECTDAALRQDGHDHRDSAITVYLPLVPAAD